MARCGLLTTECRDPTAAGERRPPHALGPGVVPAVPGLPPAASSSVLDDLLPRPRGRPDVHPLPARRPDGRGRRLPRGPPRAGGRAAGASTAPAGSPWARGTRCPTSSSSRARPSCATSSSGWTGPTSWPGGRRDAVGYLPDMFGHIAQMPQLLARFGLDHAVVWRGVPAAVDRHRLLVGGARRHPRAGRVPADGLRQRRPDARRRRRLRSPGSTRGSSASARPRAATTRCCWMNGTDHLPHQPGLPPRRCRCNRRRATARFELRDHLARRAPRRRTRRRPARRGGASCAAAPGPTCSSASPRTGSTSGRPRRAPSERSSSVAEPLWAAFAPAELWPGRLLRPGVAARWSATPRTTRSAPARTTRWSPRCSTATPRLARSARA